MEHCAIDLGGRESQICVRSSDGRIVEERRCRTTALPAYLATRPPSRVVVETCSEAFGIADAALSAGHEVRVVPATLARSLGVGARRLKTDRRDAWALSEVSCRIDLPSVHVPSRQARQRKTMCGMREALVGARTKLLNAAAGPVVALERHSADLAAPGNRLGVALADKGGEGVNRRQSLVARPHAASSAFLDVPKKPAYYVRRHVRHDELVDGRFCAHRLQTESAGAACRDNSAACCARDCVLRRGARARNAERRCPAVRLMRFHLALLASRTSGTEGPLPSSGRPSTDYRAALDKT